MIRYKIDKGFGSKLPISNTLDRKDPNCKEHHVFFHTHQGEYFLNILEVCADNEMYRKVKIFIPDGSIEEGWIYVDAIRLHHVGDVFDGRFNT